MIFATLTMDLVWAAGAFGLAVLSFLAAATVHRAVGGPIGWALAAVAFVLAFTLGATLFAALVPRPKPGRYRALSAAGVAFGFGLVARRWLALPFVSFAWHQSALLRWVVLRAQGARLGLRVQMSSDVEIFDPGYVRIEPGAMLGSGVQIASHFFVGRDLVLSAVEIGAGASVAYGVGIAPGVRIGARAVIHPSVKLAPDVEVGEEASIGLGATVGPGARVGARARVAPLAYLPARASVPDGGRFPPEPAAPDHAAPTPVDAAPNRVDVAAESV